MIIYLYKANPCYVRNKKNICARNDFPEVSNYWRNLCKSPSTKELRQQKVKQLKNEVQEGSYLINAHDLAINLLNQYYH